MFYTRCALAILLAFGLTATLVSEAREEKKAESNREKLLGVWKTVKSVELPKGSTLEFTSDKKIKLSILNDVDKEKDKYLVYAGSYKVEGNEIKVSIAGADGKEQKQTLKIVELTDMKLVTADEKGMIDEFKKTPEK